MKKIISALFGGKSEDKIAEDAKTMTAADPTLWNYFNVTGAGRLRLGPSAHSLCGETVGFSIGVSWGEYGLSGGVIGREDAIRMAKYILEKCEGITESEAEEAKEIYRRMTP